MKYYNYTQCKWLRVIDRDGKVMIQDLNHVDAQIFARTSRFDADLRTDIQVSAATKGLDVDGDICRNSPMSQNV